MTDRRPDDPRWLVACGAAIAAFLAFSFGGGADSYVRINDNLDGFVPLNVLLSGGPWLGGLHDTVPELLGGLTRNSLPSTLHLGILPSFLVGPLAALVFNEVIARIVAFVGMLLLLRRHVLPEGEPAVIHGASLCFALLPFLPSGYLSVAAQPLLLHAVLNLRARSGSLADWLVVLVFPLYSSLVYVGLFVVAGLGAFALVETLRTRRLALGLAVATLLVGGLYVATEYRLLYQMLLDTNYVSHRSEFSRAGAPLPVAVFSAARKLLFSQHHAAAVQFPVLLGTAFAALGAGLFLLPPERRSPRGVAGLLHPRAFAEPPRLGALALLLLLCGVIAACVGAWHWQATQRALESPALTLLRMFNFHRIQWFHPLLFGLVFALSLHLLRRLRFGAPLVAVLVAAQVACLVWSDDQVQERRETGLTYREFYSPALFAEIRDHIGRPAADYRVASFALMPGIPLYNGFHVVDAFLNDYPLDYKRRFRLVMADELEKDAWLADHFDAWGAHLHIYSSELGMVVGYRKGAVHTKERARRSVERLDIDAAALRALGAEYVLSAVEIANAPALGLGLERAFEREDSPWQIFLYAVPEAGARTAAGP